MTIKIKLSEMKHLKEKSCYNNNYYAFGNAGVELFQHCDEEYNTYDYYLIDGESKILLGSADGSDEEEIDFMYQYT